MGINTYFLKLIFGSSQSTKRFKNTTSINRTRPPGPSIQDLPLKTTSSRPPTTIIKILILNTAVSKIKFVNLFRYPWLTFQPNAVFRTSQQARAFVRYKFHKLLYKISRTGKQHRKHNLHTYEYGKE